LSTSANLAIGLADVRAGRAEALSILNRLLTEAERNVAVTTAHSR
jgi:hypothetical protein